MPSSQQVVVDTTLTNFVRTYNYETHRMAQDIVAPVVPCKSFKGRYKTLGMEALDIHTSDEAADRAETNEIFYDMGESTYECNEYRLKMLVTDREIKNSVNGWDPLKRAAVLVRHALMLRQEYRIVALAAATANGAAIAPDWDDAAAEIVANIRTGKAWMKDNLGLEGTHIVFGDHVADEIASQADIVAMVQAAAAMGQPTQIINQLTGAALPPTIMGLKVVVPTARYNSAAPGLTRVISHMWGDDAYIIHVDPSAQGATWAIQPKTLDYTIVRWRSNDPAGWWVKCVQERDEIETTSEAIYKLTDVT